MPQVEQYEVICKRCSYHDVLDYEPLDHKCSLCHYRYISDKEKEKTKFSLNMKPITVPPKTWLCGNHGKGFKWGTTCPQCQEEYDEKHRPASKMMTDSDIAKENEKIHGEIGISKTETVMRNKKKENLLELQKAQLETPHILKAQLKQQGQILKALEKLNKNLEAKNEI